MQRIVGVRCTCIAPRKCQKGNEWGVRCISRFGGLFGERIEAEVGGDPGVIRRRRSHLVTLPSTEGHGANLQ